MKYVSNTKKNNVNKKNRGGFTLIELLATIAVLSVVITIVIYVATGVVDSAKEKSYQVTINNIEKSTGSYVLEGNSLMPWLDGNTSNYQYQCVTVQNLIDTGYFKGDILESEVADGIKVKANNVIYLERDQNTKSITKNILLVGDMKDYENGLCGSIEADGDITISVEPSGWSREKNVTINYRILKNIKDDYKVSGYKYSYQYNTNELNNKFNKQEMTEKIHITENVAISAAIYNESGDSIANGSFTIDKIDGTGPVITQNYTGNKVVWNRVEIPVTITDSQAGVDANSVLLSDFEVSIGNKVLTSGLTLEKLDENNYKLIIENNYDAGKVKIKIGANKISDLVVDEVKNGNTETILEPDLSFSNVYTINYNANGGSVTETSKSVTYGSQIGILATPTRIEYTFLGWNTKSDGSGTTYSSSMIYKQTSDITLYAIWKTNTYTISYNANGGKGAPSSQYYTYATSGNITLSTIKPVRSGYIFKGWSTSSSATIATYSAGGSFSRNKAYDTTLYAVWITDDQYYCSWSSTLTKYFNMSGTKYCCTPGVTDPTDSVNGYGKPGSTEKCQTIKN